MPVFALFTLPDTPSLLVAIGTTSSPIVNDFMPMIELVIGIVLAFLIVKWLTGLFLHR